MFIESKLLLNNFVLYIYFRPLEWYCTLKDFLEYKTYTIKLFES